MSIHFAAARSAAHSPVARALAKKAVRRAANDNPGGSNRPVDPILYAALRHFGKHGLHAAAEAAAQAERAWKAGEMEACRYWSEICGRLDRRTANDLAQRTALQDAS
ncbi:hypothetical protein [Qipengyuania sp.]|uniref:hypothetical protein n=1 Tax=Qipengyuania sp. TaxID=2004515 RepID=UPI0035C7AFEF